MPRIALNYLPILTDEFMISLHILPYEHGRKPVLDNNQLPIFRRLPDEGQYKPFWTHFEPFDGSKQINLRASDNIYATIASLKRYLWHNCKSNLKENSYRTSQGFIKNIELVADLKSEGETIVTIEPYFLRSVKKFGMLVWYTFHPTDEYRGSTRALQLSLALDRRGQQNLDFYADRYTQIASFIKGLHRKIFPLISDEGNAIEVSSKLISLRSETLQTKQFQFGDSRISRSQFIGVKEFGPLEANDKDTALYFLYRNQDHGLSQDLYRALKGSTFHKTFAGMENMFSFPISKSNVRGVPIPGFDDSEIERMAKTIENEAHGRSVVPIVITPFSRHDDGEEKQAYWRLKYEFLARKMPIQIISSKTIADRSKLKWSASGIALQIFAKSGGVPWLVKPATNRCLIVGLGQAHKVLATGGIDRFFAYTVLTDSTGAFKGIHVLSDTSDEDNHNETLRSRITGIISENLSSFDSFVVHTPFTIRKSELNSVESALRSAHELSGGYRQFATMKFNESNRFLGFASDHNSLVPYESSFVSLAYNQFLVWFEGLQYGKTTVQKMVGRPLHVEFTYPEHMEAQQQRTLLQDAINLSGANWRGFNAKSLPVSVYYAKIIARYLREFEELKLPSIEVDDIRPWFL